MSGRYSGLPRENSRVDVRENSRVDVRVNTEVPTATDHDELFLSLLAGRDGLPLPDTAANLVLGLDPGALSQEAKLSALSVCDRVVSALAATQAALIAEFTAVERAEQQAADTLNPPRPGQSVPDPERELVACALGISPRSAAARVAHTLSLYERLPDVWHYLRQGRISVSAARIIVDETHLLTHHQARSVAAQVLPFALTATPGRVRTRTQHLVAITDPGALAENHRVARCQRRVVVTAESDGMASLWWLADTATIAIARDRIEAAAHDLVSEHGAIEGIDAARSDALAMLINAPHDDSGARVGHARPVIAVHVELSTLLGAERPALRPELGYISAAAAREVAIHADWQLFLHSADTRLAAVGTRAYRPTNAMLALVTARDRTCQFPGCAAPSHRCDIDHVEAYRNDGAIHTHPGNLQALCRRHHNLKTSQRWTATPHGEHTVWSGPHGTEVRVDHDPDPPW